MPAYSLAIFDFDGTLADSFPWFCSVLDQTTDKFSLRRIDPAAIEGMRDHSTREVLASLGVPLLKLPAITTYMRGLFTDGLAGIPLFPGAAEALAALHGQGIRLALVSSNAETNVRGVLGGAAASFDHYACGSGLWGKAGKFRSVLKATHATAATTISIGDEIRDVDAAREVRLAAGSVTFGYNSRKALVGARPDHLFDSYDELVKTVAG
jgi:phosphoglycolate phosphatase